MYAATQSPTSRSPTPVRNKASATTHQYIDENFMPYGGSFAAAAALVAAAAAAAKAPDRVEPESSRDVSPSVSVNRPSQKKGCGLKLKLWGVHSALKGYIPPVSPTTVGTKRRSLHPSLPDVDDTDSEIEVLSKKFRIKKAAKAAAAAQLAENAGLHRSKRNKTCHEGSAVEDNDDAMFDAVEEADSAAGDVGPALSLFTPALKRTQRILNPNHPAHARLIAGATKAGPEYYDSDAEDLPGVSKETNKPHLFRNVNWGVYASSFDDEANFDDEPEFTQFVPGRFEMTPGGTASDQKAKLIIKIIDKDGRKRIFRNPPPRDWNCQEAITALNKRTVQQIRRNTNVRFREVVQPYVPEERRWILENLTNGKPTNGWSVLLAEFNRRFEGRVLEGVEGTRPRRSHSSLTKEVERFGPQFYMKGLVPRA